MDFKRILANAIARRLAYVAVALLLAWVGLGRAEAAIYSNEGAAKSACLAAQASVTQGNWTPTPNSCTVNEGQNGYGNYTCYVWNSVNTLPCKSPDNNFQWAVANNCKAQPNYVGPPPASTAVGVIRNGSLTCMNGCTAKWHGNGDGTFTGVFSGSGSGGACSTQELKEDCSGMGEVGMHWNAWIQACEPTPQACTGAQVKDPATGECKDACPVGMVVNPDGQCDPEADSCPAGQIKSPQGSCLPGEGQCAVGEAPRDNGTCGKDSDGDGKADEDDDDPDNDPDKETASGGDNCNAPPSCSGSAIACIQVKIQWRIDCNTRRRVNISGGGCAAMPVCTGDNCDALEYSQLLMQWRSTCALEKLNLDGGGSGSGETGIKDHMTALKQAEVNALRNLGTDDGHGNVDPDAIFHEFDNSDFNPNLFGGNSGGQCPVALTIGGKSIQFPAGFWSVAAFIGWLMVACAYLWVAFQLGS